MDHFAPTSRHTKFHFGHTLMVIGILAFILVSLFLSAVTTLTVAAFGTGNIAALSNQARQNNGLTPLASNGSLNAAAQAKANHMVANGYFDHTSPDGTTGWYFVGQQGYSYSAVGENLAASNEDDSAVVNGWLNSPGHRANLLSSTFTEVGYGIAYQGDYQGYQNVSYIVALYAKPTASAPPPPATSQPTPPPADTAQDQPAVSEQPAAEPEPVQPTIVENDPSPAVEETSQVAEQPLSREGFRINQNVLVIALASAGLLFSAGFAIELKRLHKHLSHSRHRHMHHHA